MPVREPAWWYADHPGPTARALAPLTRVWSWLAARRLSRVPTYRSALPVICVGNFTVGGTGKTPLVAHLVQLLQARGERPAVLTRGYGGRRHGPHRVVPGLDTAADVGDEPLLLARHAPVFVARDRAKGARTIEANAGLAPATVIVMDDGLQNPSLAKDLVIAMVDGRRGAGNGLVMPAGPLRAPLDLQLGICDAIVLSMPRAGAATDASSRIADGFRSTFKGPVLEATVEPAGDTTALSGLRVLALSGIANPGRFHALLSELGAIIIQRCEFPDHHVFSDADARGILTKADRADARIVTTEKDFVRLAGGKGAICELAERTLMVPIQVAITARDATRLAALVDAMLIEHRRGRASASTPLVPRP